MNERDEQERRAFGLGRAVGLGFTQPLGLLMWQGGGGRILVVCSGDHDRDVGRDLLEMGWSKALASRSNRRATEQILILFLFILLLEDSGYRPAPPFWWMSAVGLNGWAFILLPSSFACAIPSIMAAHAIAHPLDRLVYGLLIATFVPNPMVWGGIGLQGLVMFGPGFTGWGQSTGA